MGSVQRAGRSRRAVSTIRFTADLREEYERLFATCEIRPEWLGRVDRVVARIQANRGRYDRVGGPLGIPWAVVGAMHNLESSLSFKAHLHNGDPLTARTVREPAGRPADGKPPFAWEDSATDALKLHRLDRCTDWSAAGTLFQLERFNGWGYRLKHPEVLSPYLWSGSHHYRAGKYTEDHKWSPTARSGQVGAAVVFKRLIRSHLGRGAGPGARLPPGWAHCPDTAAREAAGPPGDAVDTFCNPAVVRLQRRSRIE